MFERKVFPTFAKKTDIMKENQYDYRSYVKEEVNKVKQEKAQKNWKRNIIGITISTILFLSLILAVFYGIKFSTNFPMIGIIVSMTGVFYFSRELRIIPKGQFIATGVKTGLCWLMGISYLILHKGYYDAMDGVLLMVLFGLPLLDLPKVLKAWKEMKQ